MGTAPPFKLRGIPLNPAVDRGMVHLQTTFQHHFFEITVAERIAQVPSDAQENDVGLEMMPFERVLLCHRGPLLLFLSPL